MLRIAYLEREEKKRDRASDGRRTWEVFSIYNPQEFPFEPALVDRSLFLSLSLLFYTQTIDRGPKTKLGPPRARTKFGSTLSKQREERFKGRKVCSGGQEGETGARRGKEEDGEEKKKEDGNT